MGVSTAGLIAERLTAAGRALDPGPDRRERQPRRRAPHPDHPGRPGLAAEGLKGPALLMVGEAMAMARPEKARRFPSPASFAELRVHEGLSPPIA
jgi:uroporphyrin-III C-methyltransferase